MAWRFLEHPAFGDLRRHVVRGRLGALGSFSRAPSELHRLGARNSASPGRRLGSSSKPQDPASFGAGRLGGFDRFIARNGAHSDAPGARIHDLFGALIWLHFPRAEDARLHLIN